MKRLIVLLPFLFFAACNNAPRPVANKDQPVNAAQQSNEAKSLLAHKSEDRNPPAMDSNSAKRGPMGDPIDTSTFDSTIATAQKRMKENPGEDSKKALAEAYFERGFALTEARQYASALGDYRKALKLDPDHEEAKKWMDQIVGIYSMMKREAPKEGAEPAPLPMPKPAQ